MSDAWRADDDGVTLFVRATPGAKKNEIAGIWEGPAGEARLSVKVTAPPDKGKANAAVIKLLAKALRLPKSAFVIASGETSRLKTIEIAGDAKTLSARLSTLIEILTSKT